MTDPITHYQHIRDKMRSVLSKVLVFADISLQESNLSFCFTADFGTKYRYATRCYDLRDTGRLLDYNEDEINEQIERWVAEDVKSIMGMIEHD